MRAARKTSPAVLKVVQAKHRPPLEGRWEKVASEAACQLSDICCEILWQCSDTGRGIGAPEPGVLIALSSRGETLSGVVLAAIRHDDPIDELERTAFHGR